MKYKIALIDDQDYGISQIKNSIPTSVECEFFYFCSYREAIGKKFDIILVDYYLDIDGVRGVDIVDELDSRMFIGFSSVKRCSDEIANKTGGYSVKKLNSDTNDELYNYFGIIFYELGKDKNT